MKLAIMQPYFMPYIGYFQLMNLADEFIVYDNIEFSKDGWVNRNRILVNGQDVFITIPLKKDSDFKDIKDRNLADIWSKEKVKMLNRIKESYRKSKCFDFVFPLIEKCILFEETNLFRFIFNSLQVVCEYLEINTPIIISSSVPINHDLKSEEKVIALCKKRNAATYINPIGGTKLYNKINFVKEKIDLYFLKTSDIIYRQFDNDFVPSLSILDVLMFNEKEKIKEHLNKSYTLL